MLNGELRGVFGMESQVNGLAGDECTEAGMISPNPGIKGKTGILLWQCRPSDRRSQVGLEEAGELDQESSARIRKIGVNPYVEVPRRVSDTFGIRGNVPVKGNLNGVPIRATLVPTGKERHRLYVNGDMRKRAGVDVGETVTVDKTIKHLLEA